MDARLRELEAENERLRQEVRDLRDRVEKLTAALEEARRSGKRQAVPFRKPDGPQLEPKKPGRKRGKRHGPHAHRLPIAPDKIDERHDAPLPSNCSHCGGSRHLPRRVLTLCDEAFNLRRQWRGHPRPRPLDCPRTSEAVIKYPPS